MSEILKEGVTYDDVLVVPSYSEVTPDMVNTSTKFTKNIDYFAFNGGDMLTLFGMCKKAHAMRLLTIQDELVLNNSKKKLNMEDLENGLKIFIQNPEYAKRKDKKINVGHMYT